MLDRTICPVLLVIVQFSLLFFVRLVAASTPKGSQLIITVVRQGRVAGRAVCRTPPASVYVMVTVSPEALNPVTAKVNGVAVADVDGATRSGAVLWIEVVGLEIGEGDGRGCGFSC